MKTKSALSYFGSDSEVAQELGSLFDDCSHVTIPFVGGASILPFIKARSLVCNDLNDLAINFYFVASSPYLKSLSELCRRTLSHPKELDVAKQYLMTGDSIQKAWAYWAICWLGRKGKGGTKGDVKNPSVRFSPNGGTNASRIMAAAEDLYKWATHFKRCEWLSKDFREVIPKVHDMGNCGIYIDAPWWGAGSAYIHHFTPKDHLDLRDLISKFKFARVVVRYDNCPEVRDLYKRFNVVKQTSARNQSNKQTNEIWFTNPS